MSNAPMDRGRPRVSVGRRRVLSAASAFPGNAVTSQHLYTLMSERFNVNGKLLARVLERKLGVETRYLCRDFLRENEAPRVGHRNPELAAHALHTALAQAHLGANDLAYLICHTATPAQLIPAGSAEVAQRLQFDGTHMELRQACTGFANALQIAFALTADADAPPVAIVGSETGSVFFTPQALKEDSHQWVNFLQMGDGAAGIIIAPDLTSASVTRKDALTPHLGWISSAFFGQCQHPPPPGLVLRTGGSDQTTPTLDACGGATPILFDHDFSSVAEHGGFLLDAGRAVLAELGYSTNDASYIIPHQASGAIASWLAERWDMPKDNISNHARHVGNLGSASIWAALVDHIDKVLALQPAHDQHQRAQMRRPVLVFGAEATQYSYGGFVFEFA